MKKFMLFLMVLLLLFSTGCAALQNYQIDETATTQAIAYGAGKGMGILILNRVPAADQDLQTAFDGLMARNLDVKIVPGPEMVGYFSESVVILSRQTEDPYGLITDLSVILLIFGAQYDAAGNLVSIQPVPKSVIQFFGMGYDSGRALVLKDDLADQIYGRSWLLTSN